MPRLTTWTPTPGTIPALAIAHLRTLPHGTKLSTAELSEAIGHSTQGFAAYMKPARDLGMVAAESHPTFNSLRWWLPDDHVPVDPDKPIQKGGNHVGLERFEFEALLDFLRRTYGEGASR